MLFSFVRTSSLSRCLRTMKLSMRPSFSFNKSYSSGAADADVYSLMVVTVQDIDAAKDLARSLLDQKLAACTNITPAVSIHVWKEEVVEEIQMLLMIKTRKSAVGKLTEYVCSRLPYEIVEVISLPIKDGNPVYLQWIGKVVPP